MFSAETICSTYSIYKAALYYYGSHLINTNLSFMPISQFNIQLNAMTIIHFGFLLLNLNKKIIN